MNEDEIKGVARDAVGKVKDAAGGLTGDASLQAEGKIDQAGGKFRANTAQPRISLATQSMLSPIRRRTLPTGRARRCATRRKLCAMRRVTPARRFIMLARVLANMWVVQSKSSRCCR